MKNNTDSVTDRFLRYVKIHTASSETSGTHPSFAGEFNLANILVNELHELGISNAAVDDKCYVYAYIPATPGFESQTPLGFISHMDTSDEASGENVSPLIHPDYDGSDITLGTSGRFLSPAQFPFLNKMLGETIITSDGTTLLGADDKAGVAEIMTALSEIIGQEIPHRALYIAFTPDEEIGEGTDFFNLDLFKAQFAYTVDGGDINCIEYENFNAASAVITIKGTSVHPGDAKNVMINASNVAIEFHNMLPALMRPEHTEKREGFFHLTEMSGHVSSATLKYIIRDHDRNLFEAKKDIIRKITATLNDKYGKETVSAEITDSYYNMLEKIRPHMQLIDSAKAAIESVGLEAEEVPIRGGTDGARLSFMGIPCPNLGTGGFNFHGQLECITSERMEKAVEIIKHIILEK